MVGEASHMHRFLYTDEGSLFKEDAEGGSKDSAITLDVAHNVSIICYPDL